MRLTEAEINSIAQNLESHIASLSESFHVQQENLQRDLPKYSAEIEHLEQDLDNIHPKMTGNKESAYKNVFEKLLHLHQLVTRMEEVRGCLKDQDVWNTLAAEMDAVFISRDWDRVSSSK
jgi:septation ring formation regulator EzrA